MYGVCVAARACLDVNERRKLFKYLNLMHVSAYCALTPVYSRANFMDTFCKEHNIAVHDLYAFALEHKATIQPRVDVHFTKEGSEMLGAQVAAKLRSILTEPR